MLGKPVPQFVLAADGRDAKRQNDGKPDSPK
jgi:hypothetical protein